MQIIDMHCDTISKIRQWKKRAVLLPSAIIPSVWIWKR